MSKAAETDGIDQPGLAQLVSAGRRLPAELEAVLPDGRDEYEISPDLARLLAGIVLECCRESVLEFGFGAVVPGDCARAERGRGFARPSCRRRGTRLPTPQRHRNSPGLRSVGAERISLPCSGWQVEHPARSCAVCGNSLRT